jgi:hypothetical protein
MQVKLKKCYYVCTDFCARISDEKQCKLNKITKFVIYDKDNF